MGFCGRLHYIFLLCLGVILGKSNGFLRGVLHACSYSGSHFSLLAKRRKSARVLITLECTEARKLGLPPSRYYASKNKVNTPERLELMKYNKYLRRHTLHKEIK
ncbi:Ribosomal protein L33 family protein [Babesia bovis T2Bo]|uniref:50S ribosomal protein L33 n=1 Tax=Babesia bovis TaxID=5865 RepID=S6AZH0_BABBO|nr:Ribosomal protein L33 family protein [Babesia bovis T2Bo]EDO05648.2 Ribosomal protein L33 family protein [Babesia bovis T2Bo]BAN64438.1 50S ribosomal protein L33 [Babesia bovis]